VIWAANAVANRVANLRKLADRVEAGCKLCQDEAQAMFNGLPLPFAPRHEGSVHCRSGSIASGGTHAHCTCDTCF
jgi:hypothetical protein